MYSYHAQIGIYYMWSLKYPVSKNIVYVYVNFKKYVSGIDNQPLLSLKLRIYT